jgi:hypothetical protein
VKAVQHEEDAPLPIEPGHVMSKKKYEELHQQQQK